MPATAFEVDGPRMLPPFLTALLVLQDRDRHRRELESQLQITPHEIGAVEARIAAEKAAIETARAELIDLEAKKKVVETEIGSAEQKVAKYRAQQLEVRKNDEYRALGAEIESTLGQVGQLEEQEIALLYAIDEARKKFAAAEATLKANISTHEQRMRVLRQREAEIRTELDAARGECQAARTKLDEPTLRLYDRIASRNFPACVPMHGAKCGGCHLKVSGEVESAARAKEAKLVTCDQCGRILWWEH